MATTRRRPRSRQPELFPRSKRAVIEIAPNHRIVQITEEIDWTELEELVQAIRLSKLKNAAGRPPHLRALIGALVFRALRYRTYRDLEDLIRYYAPALARQLVTPAGPSDSLQYSRPHQRLQHRLQMARGQRVPCCQRFGRHRPAPATERDVDDGSNCEETLPGKQRHAGTGVHYTV